MFSVVWVPMGDLHFSSDKIWNLLLLNEAISSNPPKRQERSSEESEIRPTFKPGVKQILER